MNMVRVSAARWSTRPTPSTISATSSASWSGRTSCSPTWTTRRTTRRSRALVTLEADADARSRSRRGRRWPCSAAAARSSSRRRCWACPPIAATSQLFDDLLAGSRRDRWRPARRGCRSTPTGGTFPFQADAASRHYYGVGAYPTAVRGCAPRGRPVRGRVPGVLQRAGRRDGRPPARGGERAGPSPALEGARAARRRRRLGFRRRPRSLPATALRRRPVDLRARDRGTLSRAWPRRDWRGDAANVRRVAAARFVVPRRARLVRARSLAGRGWGIVDSAGRPKAAYWYLKRALAPGGAARRRRGTERPLAARGERHGEPIEAELRVALYRRRPAARRPAPHGARHPRTRLPLGPRRRAVRRLPRPHLRLPVRTTGSTMSWRRRSGIERPARFSPPPIAFPARCPRTRPSTSGSGPVPSRSTTDTRSCCETERFAHAVAIESEGFLPDDNYLHLEPGETRRVGLRPTAQPGQPLRPPSWR